MVEKISILHTLREKVPARHKTRYLTGMLMLLLSLSPHIVSAQEETDEAGNRLFHIDRSKNRNQVCYDANLVDGKLNTKKPLDIYWINNEEAPGKRSKLTAIQRNFAYGYKVTAQGDDSSELTLQAYPDRKLTICREGDRYVCTMSINGELAILQSLYVQANKKNSLKVEYVELKGISLKGGQSVLERVINDK